MAKTGQKLLDDDDDDDDGGDGTDDDDDNDDDNNDYKESMGWPYDSCHCVLFSINQPRQNSAYGRH